MPFLTRWKHANLTAMTQTQSLASPARASMFDQPRGLWVLVGTEFWERVSFHGMQALLVLYMVGNLLLPGHVEHVAGFAAFRAVLESVTGPLSVQALAAQTFGLYVGLVYFTPVIGGAIGDRLTGRRAAVVTGGVMMAAGHLCLAFDESFLLALLLLIVGAGLFSGNLSAQVKSLYAEGDRRAADAFQLYYVALNLGAFVAPIVTGALAQFYGWHLGFAFAAAGMAVGLIVYLAGQRLLPVQDDAVAATEKRPLSAADKARLAGFAMVWPLQITFWIAQSQVWNVYNLWVRDHVRLSFGAFQMPVPWLQAIDGLAPVLVMPFFLALWRRQAARGTEPDDIGKMAIGCLIFAGGTAWLALAPLVSGTDGRAPLAWAIAFHLLSNIGWLYFSPISLALYATRSPDGVRGTMLGVNLLSVFCGSTISGRLGGMYETLSPPQFWLLHAAIVGAGGVALLMVARPLRARLAATGG